jgi:bifunctional non-homologous end joining protein LigD
MAGTGPDPIAGWSRLAPSSPAMPPIIDGEIIVQYEHGISDFDALRSAIHKAPHRIVFFAFDLLHSTTMTSRTPLMERRAALRKLIEHDPRSSIQFNDHADCNRALFFKHAAEFGLGAWMRAATAN